MEDKTHKKYNLEDRTFRFAQNVKVYVDQLPNKTTSFEIGKQLIRSAGSVGSYYIEAKESRYCLELSKPNKENSASKSYLIGRNKRLKHYNIFSCQELIDIKILINTMIMLSKFIV
jgi:hypothetical protein